MHARRATFRARASWDRLSESFFAAPASSARRFSSSSSIDDLRRVRELARRAPLFLGKRPSALMMSVRRPLVRPTSALRNRPSAEVASLR